MEKNNSMYPEITQRTYSFEEVDALLKRARSTESRKLRDEMAKAAMQAIMGIPGAFENYTYEETAEYAYKQADAMLAARKVLSEVHVGTV